MVLIQDSVYGVAQTADLVLAASGNHLTRNDGFLRAWSKKDGALVFEMKTPNNQEANTVAVQGKLAAVGTDAGGLLLIDLATATVLQTLQGHTGHVLSVIFDGNEIISGGGAADKTIRVWDKISGLETLRIDVGARVGCLAVHEDLLVAGLGDYTVRVFDPASDDPRHVLTEATDWVRAVAIDAQRMVSGSDDNKVRVYGVPSFQLVRVLEGHTDWVYSVALEGDRILSGSNDHTVRVWDARNGDALHVLHGHSDTVYSVSFLGSEIVSGSGDNSVRIWDAETGASTRVLDGTEAVRPIEEVLGATATTAAAKEALKAALANGDPAELGRCKLMVVGQGAAGKTSVVRSLLGMKPEPTHKSTVGVKLTRTDAESWEKSKNFDSGFERQAYRAAALRMAVQEEQTASEMQQTLPRRVSQGSFNPVFTAEVQVELVPEAEVARRFDIEEIEDMAGKTQSGQKIFFTIWDYAGQEVFYALHHIFLTREGGVFLIVFDMQELLIKQDQAVEYLSFWLNSVKLHAPTAPIIVVGTHYDEALVDANEVEEILVENLSIDENENIVTNPAGELSFFPIDNMSRAPGHASELRAAVEASASSLEAVSRKISLRWLKVLDDLLKLDCDHVPFGTVQELATKYHAGDQTDELLSFFHELGMLVYLRATNTLHGKVVLNPQWLLDKLSRVIADKIHVKQMRYNRELQNAGLKNDFTVLRKRGIATLSLLKFLWNDEEVDYLRKFMHETMLMSDWNFHEKSLPRNRQNESLFLVSSLLKNSRDRKLEQDIAKIQSGLTRVLDFSEFFLPDGVFARMLSLCAQYSGEVKKNKRAPQLAGDRAIVRFGLSVFALEQDDNKIWVRMAQDAHKPATALKTLVSIFRGARDAVFRDLPWELLLQSPSDDSVLVRYDDMADARRTEVAEVASVGVGNALVTDFEPFFEDGSLTEDENDTGTVGQASIPLAAGLKYHVFLSHPSQSWTSCLGCQETEGNLAEDAMKRGIRESKCYLLFLSKTVFSDAVKMELEAALREEKPILVVHESDPNRPGFAPFSAYIAAAPASSKHLFKENESMPFQRRLYLAEAFYKELISRIKKSPYRWGGREWDSRVQTDEFAQPGTMHRMHMLQKRLRYLGFWVALFATVFARSKLDGRTSSHIAAA
ncbi:F-box/WD repeat-containing protein 7 [Hondaea fermentalgiana]|uniref:non-specific serine/threonine protein kinase n=1 Tax=Hondaea fermentalgiana TaxID=2315210 RepID=A0A2R5GXX6_9STRA|nr:F-box/WD repeat-containing protein 7 [Hondaea fermentalgiana]|eukprot:GBG32824.1 F-box/WD repeat-containing protein 7 [Hondaea fermentalgiana]